MNAIELYEAVEADDELEGVGIKDDKLIILCPKANLKTAIPVNDIEKVTWDELRSVLVGDREPHALRYMSRVVGYYSMIGNWNKSKIGELKDRQKGDYAIASAKSTA